MTCNLKDINISSNNISEINIDLDSIKRSAISFEQSMDLIGLLEVKIKD